MVKKICSMLGITLIPFFLFCQSYSIWKPDPRDVLYPFEGKWRVIETYELDPVWAGDIFDAEEAEKYIGETVVYKGDNVFFQGYKFYIIHESNSYFTSSEELREATTPGSGNSPVKSYDYKDLRVPDNIKVIRSVVFSYGGEPDFGRCFYMLDSETLLIDWRGWIFKAQRIE